MNKQTQQEEEAEELQHFLPRDNHRTSFFFNEGLHNILLGWNLNEY